MSIPYAALVISFAMIVLVQIAFTVELVITLIREKGKESEA
jgi:TRAP-type C4-dicarboxylate transport system permease small subunit